MLPLDILCIISDYSGDFEIKYMNMDTYKYINNHDINNNKFWCDKYENLLFSNFSSDFAQNISKNIENDLYLIKKINQNNKMLYTMTNDLLSHKKILVDSCIKKFHDLDGIFYQYGKDYGQLDSYSLTTEQYECRKSIWNIEIKCGGQEIEYIERNMINCLLFFNNNVRGNAIYNDNILFQEYRNKIIKLIRIGFKFLLFSELVKDKIKYFYGLMGVEIIGNIENKYFRIKCNDCGSEITNMQKKRHFGTKKCLNKKMFKQKFN